MSAARFSKRFASNRAGNISVMFAFSLLPIFTAAGASVDYGRALLVKSRMQTALDSAVLAGGRMFQMTSDTAQANTTVQGYFNYRFDLGALGSPRITSVSIDTTLFTITAAAQASVPTPFLGIFGNPTIDINLNSQSALAIGGQGNDKDLEVAVMLDITGSMNESTASGNSKIHDAKLGAKDLIDMLLPTGFTGSQQVRVALVPFSQYANVGPYYEDVTGQAPVGDNTCVTERTGSEKYTDEAPGSGRWIGTFSPASNHGNLDCAPVAQIMPLTNDKLALKAAIDGYVADGWTAGHFGTAWAWYVLSHKWQPWPNANRAATPNPNLRKYAILMTDGDYNTYYNNGTASQTQAMNLCTGMKADITVFTIGFGIGISQQSKDFLRDCATSPEHFFDAPDGDELRSVFRTIALKLTQLRLTQ